MHIIINFPLQFLIVNGDFIHPDPTFSPIVGLLGGSQHIATGQDECRVKEIFEKDLVNLTDALFMMEAEARGNRA